MMKITEYFYSMAIWPPEAKVCDPNGGNCTSDRHTTKSQAESVCTLLEREGFGGQGKYFPIKTWVKTITEDPSNFGSDNMNFY